MALINPQLIGLARVSVATDPDLGLAYPEYSFSNGFDSAKVSGAPNQPTIYVPTLGTYVLFLSNPEDAGVPATQGGIKARVDMVRVATPTFTPSNQFSRHEVRWYYGNYSLPNAYAGVNPKKAIVVRAFRNIAGVVALFTGPVVFDIVVFRDPVTQFISKKSS